MRATTASLLLVIGALLGVLVSSGSTRAQGLQTFELGEHDKLLAEAPGCWADCKRMGVRRVCTVKDYDCKVVCMEIPECRIQGRMPKVCAVLSTRR